MQGRLIVFEGTDGSGKATQTFTRRPSSLWRSVAATWSGYLTLNIGSWDCQSRTGCYIWISPRKFLSG